MTVTMTCEQALGVLAVGTNDRGERISARLHASTCPRCRDAYAIQPETQDGIAAERPLADASAILRFALLVVAATQFLVALPWLFGHSVVPDAHVTVAHLTRDGGLDTIIGGLGLITAYRPRYVHSTLLVTLTASITQAVAEVTDREAHAVTGAFQLFHLLVVAILIAMVCVDLSVTRRATPETRPTPLILRSR